MSPEKKHALALVAEGFQDEEVTVPVDFLREHGVEVTLAGLKTGSANGKYGRAAVEVETPVDAVEASEFDLLLLPGGAAPETLRQDDRVLALTRAFMEQPGGVVAAICHGPQVLISAGVLAGRTVTCYAGIRDDVRLAGARYVDKKVCVEGRLITSRTPEDLPGFLEAISAALGLEPEDAADPASQPEPEAVEAMTDPEPAPEALAEAPAEPESDSPAAPSEPEDTAPAGASAPAERG